MTDECPEQPFDKDRELQRIFEILQSKKNESPVGSLFRTKSEIGAALQKIYDAGYSDGLQIYKCLEDR